MQPPWDANLEECFDREAKAMMNVVVFIQTVLFGVIPDASYALGLAAIGKRFNKPHWFLAYTLSIFCLHLSWNAFMLHDQVVYVLLRVAVLAVFCKECLGQESSRAVFQSITTISLVNSTACLDQSVRGYILSFPRPVLINLTLPMGYDLDLDFLLCGVLGIALIMAVTYYLGKAGFYGLKGWFVVMVAAFVLACQEVLMYLNWYRFEAGIERDTAFYYINQGIACLLPAITVVFALITASRATIAVEGKKIAQNNERILVHMVEAQGLSQQRHDIAKNLRLMEMYIKENNREQAIDLAQKTLKMFGELETPIHTGNLYIDYILQTKCLSNRDIHFVVDGKMQGNLGDKAMDFNLLLLCLLDKRITMIREGNAKKEITVILNPKGNNNLLTVKSEVDARTKCAMEDAIIENIARKNGWETREEGNSVHVLVID